ncbi:MAG: glycosyltransferase family 4 protein, partial [Flavobacteriales bacterium]|nr:glycosyltransferase family 4 protein [Flavobacteriales bacterium]
MKTILASVYALNPQKGSEDGMGWNFVCQIARYNKVVAVTRENNRQQIEEYMLAHPQEKYQNMSFLYYDLPYYLRFWKKGSRGAMVYYYLWQLFLPIFILGQRLSFDLVHNLNFHNDWTPSMLWVLGKPMIWGPVGHHPLIPKNYLLPIYGLNAYLKDRVTWIMKQLFWKLDPFLKLTKYKAKYIFAMNGAVQNRLKVNEEKVSIMPSVASEDVSILSIAKQNFNVLAIGRFVPLKGFDVSIRSFAKFYHNKEVKANKMSRLILVGKGEQKQFLMNLCEELKVAQAVTFIDWIERAELQNIYRNASVFLFPSHEGAGMVVAEALSYGLPVLCFDNPGPGEFVNNSCGRTVLYGDYDRSTGEFAQHLVELSKNSTLLRKLSIGARAHFEKKFTWKLRGEQLREQYSRIASLSKSKEVLEQKREV